MWKKWKGRGLRGGEEGSGAGKRAQGRGRGGVGGLSAILGEVCVLLESPIKFQTKDK